MYSPFPKPGNLVQLSFVNMFWKSAYSQEKWKKHENDFAILLPKENGIHEYPVYWIKAMQYDYQWLDDLELYDENRNTQREITKEG